MHTFCVVCDMTATFLPHHYPNLIPFPCITLPLPLCLETTTFVCVCFGRRHAPIAWSGGEMRQGRACLQAGPHPFPHYLCCIFTLHACLPVPTPWFFNFVPLFVCACIVPMPCPWCSPTCVVGGLFGLPYPHPVHVPGTGTDTPLPCHCTISALPAILFT